MIKFAVLNIKDVIYGFCFIFALITIIYLIGEVSIDGMKNVDMYKAYISNIIPMYNEKNNNTINPFIKQVISNELILYSDNIQVANVNKENENENVKEQDINMPNVSQAGNGKDDDNIALEKECISIVDINNNEYEISNNVDKISIKNNTKLDIDYSKYINEKLNLFKQNKMPTILIIHTHGSESYTGVEHTDYFRNENTDLNVVRVGEELANILKNSGYEVIHDTRLYDYPTYSGSYTRALSSIQEYINENNNVQIVLDIHRDAIASDENFAPSAQIDGQTVSQISIISGTNEGGLSHPNWEENLKLALQLYNTAYEIYPDIFRPLTITKSRYNQHATNGSLILEVGATGNTLEQSILSMRYFAKILDVTLKNI